MSNENEQPQSHLKFVKRLVDQLAGEFREDRSRPSTSTTETRLDKKLHILRIGKKKDCIVCSNRQEKGQKREFFRKISHFDKHLIKFFANNNILLDIFS